ncbi:MAG: hypothetical protein BMS9Abin22_197 [Gammaproteobacteria bacterium]|nr:MAG: hypothetical protein BMS9Abin22_197 [Gammaproteobacteria bacterium]
MRYLLIVTLVAAAMLSAGCVKVYKLDTQQGNVVTQEMVDKLKPGMTRSQVRFVLGTPLIIDPFHQNRWDYFYSFAEGRGKTRQTRRLTILFRDNKLVGVQGDLVTKDVDTAAVRDSRETPATGVVQGRTGYGAKDAKEDTQTPVAGAVIHPDSTEDHQAL